MKRSFSALFWVGIVFFMAFPTNAQPVISVQSKVAEEVMATLSQWADAERDKDVKRLAQIFADDIVITSDSGSILTKDEQLEVLKPTPNVKILTVLYESVGLKAFGDVVIVTALRRSEYNSLQKNQLSLERFTSALVKRDGRWQVIALQYTRLPKAVVDAAR